MATPEQTDALPAAESSSSISSTGGETSTTAGVVVVAESSPPTTTPVVPAPTHPDVEKEELIFFVPSGAVCFGQVHNIRHGAAQPIQPPLQASATPQVSGTIFKQTSEYNFKAVPGKWKCYRVHFNDAWWNEYEKQERSWAEECKREYKPVPVASRSRDPHAAGYFCVSDTIASPVSELKRLCSVDSIFTSPKTIEKGVIFINRYDWCHFDDRGGGRARGEAGQVRFVDYSEALNLGVHELEWKYAPADVELLRMQKIPDDWQPDENKVIVDSIDDVFGVGMCVTGEYAYGRFGLTEDKSAVCSFFHYTARADDLEQLTLLGQNIDIRQ